MENRRAYALTVIAIAAGVGTAVTQKYWPSDQWVWASLAALTVVLTLWAIWLFIPERYTTRVRIRWPFRSPIVLDGPKTSVEPSIVASSVIDGLIDSGGIWFFTSRVALNKKTGSIGGRLSRVDGADMLFVVGEGFFGAHENLSKAKRVLLPDWNSDVFKEFMGSRGKKKDIPDVKRFAGEARGAGAQVRITKHFVFRSMILADAHKDSGWVHIEEALPHVMGENRVSYTVFRARHPECVDHYRAVFEALWNEGTALP